MTCFNPECFGSSDFERILFFARRRHVDGVDTVTLMGQARSEREKREVALAALLDLDDASLKRLNLFQCSHQECRAEGYFEQLKALLAGDRSLAVGA